MTAYELLTLAGLIVGPLSAVLITLWSQSRTSQRDRQVTTLRMLLNTRHLAADPAYTVAINMIPVEFNRQPRIMAAWHKYIETVRYRASPENKDRHQLDMSDKQTKMIFEILRFLGFSLSESDLQSSAYAAEGFTNRESLNIQAQLAWIRIANALEQQNAASGLPNPTDPNDLVPRADPTTNIGEAT